MTTATRKRTTKHAVSDGCLRQLDLPVHPGHLKAVRVVEANWPRITGPDWLIFYPSAIAFSVALPAGLAPGMVVEWDDIPDCLNCRYTVVTALTGTSVTFAHFGRGAAGALAAARTANKIRARREG